MRDQNENLLNGRDNNNSEPPRPSIIRRPSNVGLMSNQFKKVKQQFFSIIFLINGCHKNIQIIIIKSVSEIQADPW